MLFFRIVFENETARENWHPCSNFTIESVQKFINFVWILHERKNYNIEYKTE